MYHHLIITWSWTTEYYFLNLDLGNNARCFGYNETVYVMHPAQCMSTGSLRLVLFLSKLDKNIPGCYQYQFIPLLVYVEEKWLNILSFEYNFIFWPQNINLLYILDYTDLLWVPLFQFISCLNDEWHLKQYRVMLVLGDSNG